MASPKERSGRVLSRLPRLLVLAVPGVLALLAWEALSRWSGLPAFLLPSPRAVWAEFLRSWQDGSLLRHTGVTLREVLAGLALGVAVAVTLAYPLARSRPLEGVLGPYIVSPHA